jgi:hypothetical protein
MNQSYRQEKQWGEQFICWIQQANLVWTSGQRVLEKLRKWVLLCQRTGFDPVDGTFIVTKQSGQGPKSK